MHRSQESLAQCTLLVALFAAKFSSITGTFRDDFGGPAPHSQRVVQFVKKHPHSCPTCQNASVPLASKTVRLFCLELPKIHMWTKKDNGTVGCTIEPMRCNTTPAATVGQASSHGVHDLGVAPRAHVGVPLPWATVDDVFFFWTPLPSLLRSIVSTAKACKTLVRPPCPQSAPFPFMT